MTTAEMITMIRGYLDEATADFFVDNTDLYPALASAEIEILHTLSQMWWDRVIKSKNTVPLPLALSDSTVTDQINLGSGIYLATFTDFLYPIEVRWNPTGVTQTYPDMQACAFLGSDLEAYRLKTNPLTAGSYFCWRAANAHYFKLNPASSVVTSLAIVQYIALPSTRIASGVDPTINEVAHQAIVHRAMWIVTKDREVQLAQTHLQLYTQLLQGLMI